MNVRQLFEALGEIIHDRPELEDEEVTIEVNTLGGLESSGIEAIRVDDAVVLSSDAE